MKEPRPAPTASPTPTGDEKQLIARCRQGDTRAYALLVERYRDRAYGLALRVVRSEPDAEEVAQDAFVRAWRSLADFRGDASFGTWLYRIVYNACLDELRRTRDVVPLDTVRERPDPQPAVGERVATRRALADALAALEPADRAAVLLVDAQGFDYRSAGEVLGVPEGTVASRLNRARSRLRTGLDLQLEGAAKR